MIPAEDLGGPFVAYACEKLGRQLAQVVRCARLLSEPEVWSRANEHCNSVGNLMLHLTGNVRQWIVAGVAGQPVARDRAAEFAVRGPVPVESLIGELEHAVRGALKIVRDLDAAALAARRSIQGYDVTVLAAVFHVVEHFSGHAAQIVHVTKTLRNVDLSLYDVQGHLLSGSAP